ncbi:MAG: ankyrin repeat domain-containing protein [Gammaproteobacteria bacterium]|nr:ankyrin repeat domain-containing protein [Gammaproteobacteria bacterium]
MSANNHFFEKLTPLQQEAAYKLREKGAYSLDDPIYRNRYLESAMMSGHLEMAKWLICIDPDLVITRDARGDTPLYKAISIIGLDKKTEYVKLFIMAGANVNALNTNGNTALHAAACGNNMEILFMLLHQGASLNVTNHNRNTPVHLALMTKNTTAYLLLTLCGADLNFIPPQLQRIKETLVEIATFVNLELSKKIWEIPEDPMAEVESHLQWPPEEVLNDILDLLITPQQLPWQQLEPLFKEYSQQIETYLLARYPQLQPLLNNYRENFEKPLAALSLSVGQNPLTFHAPPPPPRRHQSQQITLRTTVLQI